MTTDEPSAPIRLRPIKRVVINVEGDEDEQIQEAWRAICSRDPNQLLLFRYTGGLVQLRRTKARGKRPGELVARAVGSGGLRAIAASCVAWARFKEVQTRTGKEMKQIPKPALNTTISAMLAIPPDQLPELDSITRVPVYAIDGRLIDRPGFDVDTGVYFDPGCEVPDIMERPTDNDIARAEDLIFGSLLRDFPFATDSDRTHAFAALINPFVRPMIAGPTPLFVFSAPQAGTGKSLLAELFEKIACGYSRPTYLPSQPDEQMKLFGSMLRQSPGRVVFIDNVKSGELDSGALALALTSDCIDTRTLGVSETESPPNRATWYLSANNVTMTRELARRSVLIRLDAGVEHPEHREGFRIRDIRSWVAANRGDLVWAVLTLVRRWQQQNVVSTAVKGSFEEWARIVGGIVASLGLSDFLKDVHQLEQDDFWPVIIREWWKRFGLEAMTTANVLHLIESNDLEFPPLEKANSARGKLIVVSRQLSKAADRVFAMDDELRVRLVREHDSHQHAAVWRLEAPRKPS